MRFMFHANHEDDADEIGVTAPVLDAHGRPLINPRCVPANHPEAFRKFKAGVAFSIDERLDPVLAGFLRVERRFQNL